MYVQFVRFEEQLSRVQPALVAWSVAILTVLAAGYTVAVLSILGHRSQWVASIGIGFAIARLLAREVGRRYLRQARDTYRRRRATWIYWSCTFGGIIIFAGSWFVASSTDALGLALLITGAGLGLGLNGIALAAAFRAGIKDFAYGRPAA